MKKKKLNQREKIKQKAVEKKKNNLNKPIDYDRLKFTDLVSLEQLKPIYIYGLAIAIFFLDQVVKFAIRKTIPEGTSIELLPFLYLTHLENTGTFFGLAKHSTGFLILFSIIVIGVVIYNYKHIPAEKFLYLMTAFVLGGAFGNLYDRILFGSVTDFFDFRVWPVFNVADSFITVAIIGLTWYAFRKD